jgi:hypothetical protein
MDDWKNGKRTLREKGWEEKKKKRRERRRNEGKKE